MDEGWLLHLLRECQTRIGELESQIKIQWIVIGVLVLIQIGSIVWFYRKLKKVS